MISILTQPPMAPTRRLGSKCKRLQTGVTPEITPIVNTDKGITVCLPRRVLTLSAYRFGGAATTIQIPVSIITNSP